MAASDVSIVRLERSHARDAFDSGVPSLDTFLRSLVSQYEKRNLGRTYVAVREHDPKVLGYYTIASGAVAFENLPTEGAKKLPRHPVPVVLIARLAVDRSAQGQRLGEKLLMDALARSVDISAKIGIYAVVVDAIDQKAKAFYEKYQFRSLVDSDLHLYLPIATASAAFPRS
ncbi:MAG: N-acetyltransferase [Isosphaeraceae bacterium]|jgi:ribosomal protein S18 acetylase RimI-like enzyme|nr:MAG: N-acetyltransferase [Isosphaeraceae bacterium]